MRRMTLQVGAYAVNCSILDFGDGRAWVIDPGAEPESVVAALDVRGLRPELLLLTHAHFDHIGAVNALQARFPGLPLAVHPEDAKVLTHPFNQCPPDYPPIAMPNDVRDCRAFAEPGAFEVLETPGHTPGGCCYYFPKAKLLLSGDTLFAGSCGRTDLPGGDMATLMRSLAKLKALPGDVRVVPGHGPETTIADERAGNVFLQD